MASSTFLCLYLNQIFEPILILLVFKGSFLIVNKSVTSDIKNPMIYVSTRSLCVRVLICVRDEFRLTLAFILLAACTLSLPSLTLFPPEGPYHIVNNSVRSIPK